MRTRRLSPARSTAISGIAKITAMSQPADIVAAIPTIADTTEEHQVLMILIVRVILVEAVIKSARVMDTLIVLIRTPAVEPQAVPWSSRVATSPATTSAAAASASRASSHL